MSFTEHVVVTSPIRQRNEGVSASLQKLAGAPAKLHLTFKSALLVELRWRYEDRFVVMLGQHSDHGRIRLKCDPEGPAELVRRSIRWDQDFGDINLGIISMFPDEKQPSMNCKLLRLPDGWVEIALPAWAQRDPERRGPGRPAKSIEVVQ